MHLDAMCLDHTLACIPPMGTVVRRNWWGRFYKGQQACQEIDCSFGFDWVRLLFE